MHMATYRYALVKFMGLFDYDCNIEMFMCICNGIFII